MPEVDKRLLRLASAIHIGIATDRHREQIDLPTCSWDRCAELVRQCQRAEMRGWKLAADQLQRDLGYAIPTLQAELNSLVLRLLRATPIKTNASVGDIYADLWALQKDFDSMDCEVRGRWISVTTEPITLQDIYLGPFEIRLDCHRIGDDCPYRVIAKEPHPCESRENVTHPHVMDERLCEGDSRQAIRQALAQGRLLDFFMLVANGLRSYNSDSPFVGLELWYGSTCSDCGVAIDEDEGYACHGCHEVVCGECEVSCATCDNYFCCQCIATCEVCDDNFCRSCLASCKGCQKHVCSGCLNEHERCSNCDEDQQQQTPITHKTSDGASVQSHCLGQAPVPA